MRRISFLFFLLITAGSTVAVASSLSKDTLTNHFQIHLGQKDRGTLYFLEDGSFEFLAAPTNVDYVHNCGGSWLFSEKTQMLRMRAGRGCHILSDKYLASPAGRKIHLNAENKSFILEKF